MMKYSSTSSTTRSTTRECNLSPDQAVQLLNLGIVAALFFPVTRTPAGCTTAQVDSTAMLLTSFYLNSSDLKRDNSTTYDPVSGAGSLGVEFAGSAVSSPSSCMLDELGV